MFICDGYQDCGEDCYHGQPHEKLTSFCDKGCPDHGECTCREIKEG